VHCPGNQAGRLACGPDEHAPALGWYISFDNPYSPGEASRLILRFSVIPPYFDINSYPSALGVWFSSADGTTEWGSIHFENGLVNGQIPYSSDDWSAVTAVWDMGAKEFQITVNGTSTNWTSFAGSPAGIAVINFESMIEPIDPQAHKHEIWLDGLTLVEDNGTTKQLILHELFEDSDYIGESPDCGLSVEPPERILDDYIACILPEYSDCPQVGGSFRIFSSIVYTHIELIQNGCDFELTEAGARCTGTIASDGTMSFDCDIFLVDCEGMFHHTDLPIGFRCADDHYVHLYPDIFDCWSNEDCETGQSCQTFIDHAGQSITNSCSYGGGTGIDNTGDDCSDHSECFSMWCLDYPAYCTSTCWDDADCPGFSTGDVCAGDQDCMIGYLCYDSVCERRFGCRTKVVDLGVAQYGEPVVGWVNLCTPESRSCEIDSDCLFPLRCRLTADPKQLDGYQRLCEQRPDIEGKLGDACSEEVGGNCQTGVCVTDQSGTRYCSRFCSSSQDCQSASGDYSCRTELIEIWPGFTKPLSVCALP
jgi:hypothetical protein